MSEFDNDFDFIDHYGSDTEVANEEQLPENEAPSAINCGFVGVGGGGGKLAKAFLDLGFNKTLLVNTTEKDQPDGVDEAGVRAQLLARHNLEIGAGLGPMAGKIWRIGLMGQSCTQRHVDLCLSALGEALHGAA